MIRGELTGGISGEKLLNYTGDLNQCINCSGMVRIHLEY